MAFVVPGFLCQWRSIALGLLCLLSSAASAHECVVLLHGWGRTSWSMQKMADALEEAGYVAQNLRYKTRSGTVEQIAERTMERALQSCEGAEQVHFVTHSMGGILVRDYFATHEEPRLGRVVMLGPPNQGTRAVNRLLRVPGMAAILGPAGRQLGEGEEYLPAQLPPVNFELGIIAGTRALNPILSFMVENPDDGTVSVAATQVDGMCAHVVMSVTHSLMMRNDEVIAQTLDFLREGRFSAANARNDLCATSSE